MNFDNRRITKIVALLPVTLLALTVLPVTLTAHAYGAANWQVGFAGTFVSPGTGSAGFWGWCDFAGGTGSPATSGTNADCQKSQYLVPGQIQLKLSIQGTAWDVEQATFHPGMDFFITAGTMTLSGPSIVQIMQSGGGEVLPPSCTVSGSTVACPLYFWRSIGVYSPDTGIPAAAGHYNLNFLLNEVGELQIQVTQIG